MKKSLIAIAIGPAMAGCASVQEAGNTGVHLTAYKDDKGATKCCELSVQDGKEYAGRTVTFSVTPQGSVSFSLSETGTKAFKGQAISAKAIPAPVSGLADLLGR